MIERGLHALLESFELECFRREYSELRVRAKTININRSVDGDAPVSLSRLSADIML